jgi:hypothetical protein
MIITSGFFWITDTHANVATYCEREFNLSFQREPSRLAKKQCTLIFQHLTWQFETGNYMPFKKLEIKK